MTSYPPSASGRSNRPPGPARRRGPAIAALLVAFAAVGAAIGYAVAPAGHHAATPPTTTPTVPPTSPPPGSTVPAGALKPELTGLLDRNGPPPAAFAPELGGFVINVNWSQLQPTPGAPIPPNNPIDQGLAALDRLNASGAHLYAKIRVFAGVDAPDWAKNLGGPPIPVHDPTAGRSGTIGRFWIDAYGAAYDDLMNKLAAKYDADPRIRDVTISRCMIVFAEPFIRDISDSATVHALLAAGFSASADLTCEEQAIQEARVWRTTHSSLSFNPYQQINSDGSTSVNLDFTYQVMRYCRQVLGPQCTLENNSLRASQSSAYRAMYTYMASLGPPICFQTATSQRIGNLQSTISEAMGYKAGSIELPSGYQNQLAPSQASSISQQLGVNVR